ncbi:MAG TPA: FKBP-type peptidyl-prolyl cis-trans isomerase [Chitinophagaceae bacterium]|nr:FKBP-type peptidyl-prolyl cis-trans isomerase [Chitinophagaceae bacterium]
MKRVLTFTFLLFIFSNLFANNKDSTISYSLPDSVKAISFLTEITVTKISKKCEVGIKTNAVTLSLEKDNNSSIIRFTSSNFPSTGTFAMGINVHGDLKYDYPRFVYDWKKNQTYRLLISQATDSAENFSLYSGYIFLPEMNKWKLIGTLKIQGRWNALQKPAIYYRGRKRQPIAISISQVWVQRQNGSWKNMLQKDFAPPVVNLYSHVDSLEQLQIDKKLITQAVAENKTDVKNDHDGIYYTILKEGNGRQVSVNDTVTVFYKGYLFSDNSVFDQTKDKPATFPLKRLIVGWQIGVPLCKVGGKIKIIIPSNLAYSIRTRSAKIPPNSILVFEIEVVDAKSPQ